MTTIDREYFAALPDKPASEWECKPLETESIPAALNDAMRTWVVVGILGLCVISFGVLLVVFGGGK